MKKLTLFLLLMSYAGASHALERRVTDGPFIGFVTGGDTQGEEFTWGWQGAYDFYRWLTMEISYSRHADQLDPRRLTALGLPPGSSVDLEFNNIALSGRWHLYHGNYHSIYFGAGGNYYLINEDAQDTNKAIARAGSNSVFSDFSADFHAAWGYHASIGLELSLHKHWEVFAEYRHNAVTIDSDYQLVRTAANGNLVTTTVNDQVRYDHNAIRLGVNYRF